MDGSDTSVWSTNITGGNGKSPVVAEVLDNGNSVLRKNDQGSHSYTLLPPTTEIYLVM